VVVTWRLAIQDHALLPSPRQRPIRRAQQPAVQVADEQYTVGDRRKALGELLRRVGRTVEVPQVFNQVWVEPRFNVGEQAAVDLQGGLQAAHEVEDGGAVALRQLTSGSKHGSSAFMCISMP
jgi:hypothetical protein